MPDTIQSAQNPRTPERRLRRRQRILFSCIQLEDDNGGIILDISESGLAMQPVRSLEDGRLPRMRFQFSQSQPWIETRGRIVWNSASRKTAGVEFVGLSKEARNQIRQWVSSTLQPGGSEEENEPDEQTEPVKDLLSTGEPLVSIPGPKRESVRSIIENQSRRSIAENSPGFLSITRTRHAEAVVQNSKGTRRKLVTIACVLAVGISVGVLSLYAYNRGSLEPLARLRKRISADFQRRPAMAAPAPIPRSASESIRSVGGVAGNKPEPNNSLALEASGSSIRPSSDSGAGKPSSGIDNSGVKRASTAYLKEGNGQAELRLARSYLSDGKPQDRVDAVNLLWSAIGKGNREAELQLAGIYLRGEDVPRNCEQARVLLRAAKNGSDAAVAPDLQKLLSNDCK
jgi:PilZ domain